MRSRLFHAWRILQPARPEGDAIVISRRSILGGIASLATLAPFGVVRAAAESAGEIPIFRRGIGVSHALGWADVDAGGSYGDAPFSAPRFRFDAGAAAGDPCCRIRLCASSSSTSARSWP